MKDCVKDITIASEMPEFARNQNGNLAQQKRPLGPDARASIRRDTTLARQRRRSHRRRRLSRHRIHRT